SQLAVRPHHRDIEHADREVPVHALALRHIPDAPAHFSDGLAQHSHLARGCRHQPEDGLEQRALAGPISPDNPHKGRPLDDEVHVPQHWPALVRHRQVMHVEYGRAHFSAFTIVRTLCLTIPTYVPSGVPSLPIASENNVPPTTTLCPLAWHPSISASTLRSDTLLSTKIALMRRSTRKSTRSLICLTPASLSVLIP